MLNKGLEPRGQDAPDELHDIVLKGDGTEPVRREHVRFLGEQSDESSVHTIQRGDAGMKISKELHHVTSNHIPKGAVEGWPKAIGTGTAVDTHRSKGVPRLRLGEGSLKGVQTSHWGKNTMKVEVPNRG
jgi:hypothetical protein